MSKSENHYCNVQYLKDQWNYLKLFGSWRTWKTYASVVVGKCISNYMGMDQGAMGPTSNTHLPMC